MNEKGHEFGTEQGGVYRRVWGKKKEGERMKYITISKTKQANSSLKPQLQWLAMTTS